MKGQLEVLVTGGAGFIGSNFINLMVKKHPEWHITNLDKLTYCGNLDNLKSVDREPNYQFILGDITNRHIINQVFKQGFDIVVNFAAESHVDNSIADAFPFIDSNIMGVLVLLSTVVKYGVQKFVQISTDEVYGSIEKGYHSELSPLSPRNSYATSKAAADLLCLAYYVTHNVPVVITRSCNNFGRYQFPEKLIPKAIINLLNGNKVPLYGSGRNVREWIYVDDNCTAIERVILSGEIGEIYNVSSEYKCTNEEIVRKIIRILGKSDDMVEYVPDRLGHDFRYSMYSTKIKQELGWNPSHSFDEALERTVKWFVDNKEWWEPLKDRRFGQIE